MFRLIFRKRKVLWGLIIISGLLLFSCSKDDSSPLDPGGGNGNGVSGTIYFQWADEGVLKIDSKTGKKSTVLPDNDERHDWDISQDGKLVLQITDAPTSVNDYYNANVYTLTKLKTGKNTAQFIDYHYEGFVSHAYLSPDQTKIAVASTYDTGNITIFDLEGNVLVQIPVNEESEIAWMPDGTLIFKLQNAIIRTNTDFTDLSIVKQFQFNEWGNIAVSPDGSKIALYGGKHIWVMNSDGSNLKQVTTGGSVERHPVFSPNGKYLLIGTDYHQVGPFGHMWYLAIVPADGQTYNVDEGADDHVIFIKDPDDPDDGQPADDHMVWR